MRVYVGKRHIREADRLRAAEGRVSAMQCPIALALKDRPGVEFASVLPHFVSFGTLMRKTVYCPAQSARNFIFNYDKGYPMRPGYVHLSKNRSV